MAKFEVQHRTIVSGWLNTWTQVFEDGSEMPLQFDSMEDAQRELDEFIAETEDAVARGFLDTAYTADAFRIVEID